MKVIAKVDDHFYAQLLFLLSVHIVAKAIICFSHHLMVTFEKLLSSGVNPTLGGNPEEDSSPISHCQFPRDELCNLTILFPSTLVSTYFPRITVVWALGNLANGNVGCPISAIVFLFVYNGSTVVVYIPVSNFT